MSDATQATDRAWGLELGETLARLVRVARAGAGYRVEAAHHAPLPAGWTRGGLDAAALAALPRVPAGEPLGVRFPDELMLCRGFSLPQADRPVLEKMVRAQAEVLLATGNGRLVWGWEAGPDPFQAGAQWVLFCAARREAVEQIGRVAQVVAGGAAPVVLLPQTLAGAWAYTHRPGGAAEDVALVRVSSQVTAVAVLKAGRLLRCTVLDGGVPAGADSDGALRRWAWQVRESYGTLLEGMPPEQRPTRGVLLDAGHERGAAALAAVLTPALGLPLEVAPPPEPPESAGSGGGETISYPALGAALRALAGPDAGITLAAGSPATAPAAAPRSRRWLAVLTAACVAGVLLLYAADVVRARWLGGQVEQFRAAEAVRGGFERRLATAKYLDRNQVTALRVLDAVSGAAPPGVMMTSLNYTRGGTLRLTGTMGNPAELEGFLRQLQATRVVIDVELRAAQIDPNSRQTTFEITAGLAPYAPPMPAPVPVPPTKESTGAAPKPPPQTQPAMPATQTGAPATRPSPTSRPTGPGGGA